MRYKVKLVDYPTETDASSIIVPDLRCIEVYNVNGTDIKGELIDRGVLTDGSPATGLQSFPLSVAQALAEYIDASCYTPCDVVATQVFDTEKGGFFVQPFSSQQVKEDRTTIREDLVFQLVYASADSTPFLFDKIERTLDSKMIRVGRESVFVYSFAYNSPVSVNKMTSAEGFIDTEELGDRMMAITSALVYARRWFCEV